VQENSKLFEAPILTIWFIYFSFHFSAQAYSIDLVYQGKDIVFRFIIEYSSLMDFRPKVIIGLFLYEDFLKDGILACVETWD
jgi:hypothetical protein